MIDDFTAALAEDDPDELYEQAPCGYLSTSPDGTITKANRTLARMTGYDADVLVGRRFESLLTKAGQVYVETHYRPMLRMQSFVREIALDIVRADQTRLPVLVNAVVKRSPDGEPLVVRIAVFDATERRRYEDELLRARDAARESEARARELAATLQASLIPPDPPAIAGFDIAAEYHPAGAGDEVGGDFYDVFEVGRGDWGLVVGDVCGKGAAAATVTALARHTLRAAATRVRRPRPILALLNEALLRQGAHRYCTVVYGRLRFDVKRRRLTIGSAGHWLPLRVAADGHVAEVGKPGLVCGVFDDFSIDDVTVELHPGDAVVFFTDGVVEARSGDEQLGHERLVSAVCDLAGRPASEIAAGVLELALRFQAGRPKDDIAILVLRVPPGP